MKKSDIKEVSTSRRKYLKDIRLKKIKIMSYKKYGIIFLSKKPHIKYK